MRLTTILLLSGCLLQTSFASRFSRNAFLDFHRNADRKRNTASQEKLQHQYLLEKYLETTQLAKRSGVQQHFANRYFKNYYQTYVRN